MKSLPTCCILLLAVVVAPAIASAEPTFAERLGWPAGSRVVIFHCDDAGMSHSSNIGAIESIRKGVVTSVSAMMPCGWAPEWAAILKENPNVDNGIHLTLTSEWDKYRWVPLAGRDVVPGLRDQQGCLWDTVELVPQHASPEEVEKEIRAQIARAEEMGIPITHLDTHMGTVFAKPEYFMVYVKVAIEKHIPVMAPGGHLTHAARENGEAVQMLKDQHVPEQLWAAGLPVIDDVHTDSYGWDTFEKKKAGIIAFLRDLKPGITQCIVHCTRPTDEFQFISPSGPTRLADLQVMTGPDIKKVIQEEAIILTTWRELKQRRDAVK